MTAQNMCGTKTGKLYPMKHYFFFSESFRSLLYFGYCQYCASPTNLVADIQFKLYLEQFYLYTQIYIYTFKEKVYTLSFENILGGPEINQRSAGNW